MTCNAFFHAKSELALYFGEVRWPSKPQNKQSNRVDI
jgi:hypothetical protein